jgi:hypothetical protein
MVVNTEHAPFLPPFVLVHDHARGTLLVQGTWALEDDKNAWPTQTTTIECDRTTLQCLEATAIITGQDGQLFPLSINRLAVQRWDDELVAIKGTGAACVDEIYSIQLRTRMVTGLVTRKPVTGENDFCSLTSSQPKRMRMIDGYEASRVARRLFATRRQIVGDKDHGSQRR